jgi:phospholipid N-methyltransferase
VIEIEEVYAKLLQQKFWEKIVVELADVKDIELIRKKYILPKIDLIISWLPFLPAESIHDELKEYLSQGTIFRTFTYQPSKFKKLYIDFPLRKIGFTCINIPPTRVYGAN